MNSMTKYALPAIFVVGLLGGMFLFDRLIRLPSLPFSLSGKPEVVLVGKLTETPNASRPGMTLATLSGPRYVDLNHFSRSHIAKYLNTTVVVRGVPRSEPFYEYVLVSWIGAK